MRVCCYNSLRKLIQEIFPSGLSPIFLKYEMEEYDYQLYLIVMTMYTTGLVLGLAQNKCKINGRSYLLSLNVATVNRYSPFSASHVLGSSHKNPVS